jgi:hypothetical protein
MTDDEFDRCLDVASRVCLVLFLMLVAFGGGTLFGILWYEREILPLKMDQAKASCGKVEACE